MRPLRTIFACGLLFGACIAAHAGDPPESPYAVSGIDARRTATTVPHRTPDTAISTALNALTPIPVRTKPARVHVRFRHPGESRDPFLLARS